jgi:hypothetical protein
MTLLRLVLLACVAGLALTGSAFADHQDPRKRITAADQSRARAMLLQQSDFAPGFKRDPASNEPDPHIDCPRSVSEADLTLTGDVDGPTFTRGVVNVQSIAQVYESVADASASWRRGTSAAGVGCARALLRREFAKAQVQLVSLRKVAFPRIGERTVAYRVVLSAKQGQMTLTFYLDLVVLMHSRAHAQVIAGSAFQPSPKAEAVRLARIVGGRMARAMRGS